MFQNRISYSKIPETLKLLMKKKNNFKINTCRKITNKMSRSYTKTHETGLLQNEHLAGKLRENNGKRIGNHSPNHTITMLLVIFKTIIIISQYEFF